MASDVQNEKTEAAVSVRLCNFPTGKATPLPAHQEWAKNELAPLLKGQGGAFVDLIGFASKLGFAGGDSAEKNRKLSNDRVEKTKLMIQQAVPGVRINVNFGLGSTTSTGGANDDDGLFRAVLVKIFGIVAPPPTPPAPVVNEVSEDTDIILAKFDELFGKSDLDNDLTKINALTEPQRAAINLPFPLGGAPGLFLPGPPVLVPLINHPQFSLRLIFEAEARPAGAFSTASGKIISDFYANNDPPRGAPKFHGVGTPLANTVAENDSFKASCTEFEKSFTKKLQEIANTMKGTSDLKKLLQDILAALKKTPPVMEPPDLPGFRLGSPLAILGAFQAVTVRLKKLTLRKVAVANVRFEFEAKILYEWFDHFGCDDSDVTREPGTNHGTPGQIALWILARKHHPGHNPYRIQINSDRSVKDRVT